jgi:hypothetical protein
MPGATLRRTFRVRADAAATWARLADVGSWPEWARHIRSVSLEPPGPLGPKSRGSLRLTNGVRSTFEVTEFEAGRRWRWVGPFLWLRIDYDHVVAAEPSGGSRVEFVVEASGALSSSLGRLFAWVYARNLDRAIPLLQASLGGDPTANPSGT